MRGMKLALLGLALVCLTGCGETAVPAGGGATKRPASAGAAPTRGRGRRAMRAGSLVCAMVSGAGAAFLGMGIAMQHQATILLGALIASVFLLAGSAMEWEEER